MNTLNFTFNFNAPVGQNIAHVDKLEAHFDKDMTMQVVDTAAMEHPVIPEAPSPRADAKGASVATTAGLSAPRSAAEQFLDGERLPLPEPLLTDAARTLHAKLMEAGLVNEAWQPVGLSNAERGMLVFQLAVRLDIQNQWQVFASLWGTTPGTLRSAYNKANEQRKTMSFIEKLNAILN